MNSSPPAAIAEETERQRRVLAYLEETSFGQAQGGKRIDTHASVVLLGGDRVLKIKKALRLPFLDYSTLGKRKEACEEELKVNAGNAPDIYLRVVAITHAAGGGFEIGGAGPAAEWAVEMARFDEDRTLDRIAQAGPISPSLAIEIAQAILQSHRKAKSEIGEDWPGSIAGIIDRNTAKFRTVPGLDGSAVEQLHVSSHNRRVSLDALLRRRSGQGLVRHCHGDLHLANIALVNGRPLLFDAIEFDPAIATTDILYDLGFTLMDLIHFANAPASNVVFNHYLSASLDDNLDGLAVLPLFLSLRAAIRAHVLFQKSEQMADGAAASQQARAYFDLAMRLINPKPPVLLAIGGRSGTGKTVLARALAGALEPSPGALVLRSDVIRKHLSNVSATTRLPEEAYQSAISQRVYDWMAQMAGRALAQGCPVILDAAFLQEEQRAGLPELARRHHADFAGLFLTADLATRLCRIEHRDNDASDATREVAVRQERDTDGVVNWHSIDASGSPDETLRQSLACLAAQGFPIAR